MKEKPSIIARAKKLVDSALANTTAQNYIFVWTSTSVKTLKSTIWHQSHKTKALTRLKWKTWCQAQRWWEAEDIVIKRYEVSLFFYAPK